MVKPAYPNKLFFPPQQNQNKPEPNTEECSQFNPESDVEETNECDANENETDPFCIEWDKDLQNGIAKDQRNGAKHKAACAHQSSFHVETKLSYF